MNTTKDECPGAVAGQVDCRARPPLRMTPGSDGYYLHSVGGGEDVLLQQPEPKWFEKLKNAEASAIAIAERTGIAVIVVRVMSRVVPWHQS